MDFDIIAVNWRIIYRDTMANNVFDGDETTFWTRSDGDYNQVIIDLGQKRSLKDLPIYPTETTGFQ